MKRIPIVLSLVWMVNVAHGQSFYGYDCTEDCSGHEAGYEWAEENGIGDTDECSGNSNSFVEGCEAYAEENYEDEDDENNEW